MKNKICLTVSFVCSAVCFVLRLLQHLFIIDESGYFIYDKPLSGVLIPALYIVFGLAAGFCAVLFLSGRKTPIDSGVIQSAGSLSVLYIVAAVLIMVHSGICFVTSDKAPTVLVRLLAAGGLLSGVYFATLGVGTLKNKLPPVLHLFGLFPPVYICLFGVCEFYKSFEFAQKSETAVLTLSVCALTVFITSVTLSTAGVNVTMRRMAAITTLYPVFALSTAPFFMLTDGNPGSKVFAVIQLLFVLISFIVLARINYVKPQYSYTEDNSPAAALDIYMDDIPEEKEDENE